jgi:hypothetical protein
VKVAFGATVLALLPAVTTLVDTWGDGNNSHGDCVILHWPYCCPAHPLAGRPEWLLFLRPTGEQQQCQDIRRQPFPVEDESFLDRVRELAARMHLPTPKVHLLRSLSADQQAMGYVVGLAARRSL